MLTVYSFLSVALQCTGWSMPSLSAYGTMILFFHCSSFIFASGVYSGHCYASTFCIF